MMDNPLMSREQVATLLNASPNTVSNWVVNGWLLAEKTDPLLLRSSVVETAFVLRLKDVTSHPEATAAGMDRAAFVRAIADGVVVQHDWAPAGSNPRKVRYSLRGLRDAIAFVKSGGKLPPPPVAQTAPGADA